MPSETLPDLPSRLGGLLVAPKKTWRALVQAPAARGATDVALLIAARLIAGELPRIVHEVVRGVEIGVGAGLAGLLNVIGTVVPDVLAILIAGLIGSVVVGRRRAATAEPRPSTSEPLDIAAWSWVPYLAVQLAGALLYTVRGYPPSARAQELLSAIALGWSVVVWALGLWTLRAHRRGEAA